VDLEFYAGVVASEAGQSIHIGADLLVNDPDEVSDHIVKRFAHVSSWA